MTLSNLTCLFDLPAIDFQVRVGASQLAVGTRCRAQESSGMMLRVSLRSRELLGARTPIFPWAPVPASERRESEWRGYGMGNQREKRKKVSMD